MEEKKKTTKSSNSKKKENESKTNNTVSTKKKSSTEKKTSTTKKVEKKTDENKEQAIELVETNILDEEKTSQVVEDVKKHKITFREIIKLILLIVTFPVWFPWKILFVRRKGRKYREVSTPVKVFRILRAPITKPLKFAIFIFILFIEISCLYKIRYSPITYTITRASVHNYYLKEESETKLLSLVDDVYASDLSKHREEFKTAFSYIDEWGLSEKNKMYVILDSKAVKYVYKYAADEDVTYLLTRFNTDENLRNDIKNLVTNINKLITRGFNEVNDLIPKNNKEIKVLLEPFTTLGKTLDYTVLLNTIGNTIELVESQSTPSTMQPNKKEDLEYMIDTIIKYSKGAHLRELGDFSAYEGDSTPTNRVEVITAN